MDYSNNLKNELRKEEYKQYNLIFSMYTDDEMIDLSYINVDVLVAISKNVNHIIKKHNLDEILRKETTIYIVTNSLDTSNVVDAINLTPYVSYINKSPSKLAYKLITIANAKKK